MRLTLLISLLLHVGLAGIWLLLPDSWRPTRRSVEIIPIDFLTEAEFAELTSVPATRADPEPEPDPPAPERPEETAPDPEPAPEESPVEETPAEEVPPPLPPEEPVEDDPTPPVPDAPDEEPTEEPAEETPPVAEPDEAEETAPSAEEPEEVDPLAGIGAALNSIDPDDRERTAPREVPDETGTPRSGDRDRPQVGAGAELTMNEITYVQAKIVECWNLQAFIGAPKPEELVVEVEFDLNPDGSLSGDPRIANALEISLSGNQYWRIAEREALRAVRRCAPYDRLPSNRYEVWKEFKLTFSPADMAGI